MVQYCCRWKIVVQRIPWLIVGLFFGLIGLALLWPAVNDPFGELDIIVLTICIGGGLLLGVVLDAVFSTKAHQSGKSE
jgi:hypothetical protein